jgi:DAACS family dicarboxylate/amino acid:cation (Na+ or H+) symporter
MLNFAAERPINRRSSLEVRCPQQYNAASLSLRRVVAWFRADPLPSPPGVRPLLNDHDAVPRRLALHWKILIGLLIGATVGLTMNAAFPSDSAGKLHPVIAILSDYVAYPIGQVFLRLIFMVVVPLVFSALVLGVAEIGDVRQLGAIGLRTLAFTALLSTASVFIGVSFANLVRPGDRLTEEQRHSLQEMYKGDASETEKQAQKAKPLIRLLLDIIPRNPLQEAVGALDGSSPGNGMLAVMFYALMIGLALAQISPDRAQPVLAFLQGVYDVVMTVIGWAMRLAPLGVGCLVFTLTATLGLTILQTLAWYVAAVVLGLAIHMFGIYPIVIVSFTNRSPWAFFRDVSEAMLTGFGTSSSNATLPTALRVAEERLRLRPEVSRFVLTVGATANQNGTALYEGITVLFLAQVFGVELTLTQQVTVVLMSILAGIGTAGVPGGSLPMIVMVLVSVGVPAEGIGIILGVDRVLDMCRTTLNVVGDIVIAACVDQTTVGNAATEIVENASAPEAAEPSAR